MTSIDTIIDELCSHPHCSIFPPSGIPETPAEFPLPADLRRFYELAGGAIIHSNHKCALPTEILSPEKFQRIDETISSECFASGPFRHWFAVADVGDRSFISIDLHPEHTGLCYDSFHETFAMPGSVNVIATSFTDLLSRLIKYSDDSSYWLQDDFSGFGEAFSLYGFDSIEPSSDGAEET